MVQAFGAFARGNDNLGPRFNVRHEDAYWKGGLRVPLLLEPLGYFLSKSRFFQTYPGLFDFRREPAAFKTFFGLGHGGLGSFNVDIFRLLGDLCKDGDFVGRHVGESPQHRHVMLGFSNTIVQFADPKGRQKMTMARQHAKVAFRSGRGDLVHVFTHQELIRCHHFQQEFSKVTWALSDGCYLYPPLSFVSQFLRLLDRFFNRPDHVKRLLRQIVMLAVDDFFEAPDGVLEFHVFPRRAREGFGHVERLRQEALQLSRARDGLFVFFGQLVHTENGNDVLQVFIPLQGHLDLLHDVIVLFPEDVGIENSRRGIERVHRRVNAQFRQLPGQHGRGIQWANVVAGAGSVRSSAGT